MVYHRARESRLEKKETVSAGRREGGPWERVSGVFMMNYGSHLSSKVFRWACSLCLKVVKADVRSLENPFVLAMAAPTPAPLRRSRDAPLVSVSDTFKEVQGSRGQNAKKKKGGCEWEGEWR